MDDPRVEARTVKPGTAHAPAHDADLDGSPTFGSHPHPERASAVTLARVPPTIVVASTRWMILKQSEVDPVGGVPHPINGLAVPEELLPARTEIQVWVIVQDLVRETGASVLIKECEIVNLMQDVRVEFGRAPKAVLFAKSPAPV